MRSRRLTALVLVAAILVVAAVPTAVHHLAVEAPGGTIVEFSPAPSVTVAWVAPAITQTAPLDSTAPRPPPRS